MVLDTFRATPVKLIAGTSTGIAGAGHAAAKQVTKVVQAELWNGCSDVITVGPDYDSSIQLQLAP